MAWLGIKSRALRLTVAFALVVSSACSGGQVQVDGGDGWRFIDSGRARSPREVTGANDIFLVRSVEEFLILIEDSQVATDPNSIDFETENAIWYATLGGGLPVSDVVFENSTVGVKFVPRESSGDELAVGQGFFYVVAVEKDRLPNVPFVVEIGESGPRSLRREILE